MHRSPDDELQAGPMPETAERHGEEKIKVSAQASLAIAAEGYVEVIAQP